MHSVIPRPSLPPLGPPPPARPRPPSVSVGAGNGEDDDDDGMVGAIDINDVDWASNSDAEVGGGGSIGSGGGIGPAGASGVGASAGPPPALPPMINVVTEPAPSVQQRPAPSAAAVAAATGLSRTGGGASSGVATALATTSIARAVPPPLFAATPHSAAPLTRGSRNLRTSPFNLKACSACKKGRASAIKCRVDRRHWEDPDWTDPPSRPWVMPNGFVDWLAKEDRGPLGEKPGSPTNAATAAAAKKAMEAAQANRPAGPRAPRTEAAPAQGGQSASALLTQMLGAAALPAPVPAPPAPAPILAPRVAPGGPVIGGGGIKRPRCLAKGCNNAVAKDVAFCSDDCIVAVQKEAVVALLIHHGKQQQRGGGGGGGGGAAGRIAAGVKANGSLAKMEGIGEGEEDAAVAAAAATPAASGSAGGDAAAVGADSAKGTGGGGGGGAMMAKTEAMDSALAANAASAAAASTTAAGPKWTEQDEQNFSKGLEAVRARAPPTPALRFRHKVMDRFRELFAEGMAELGLDSTDAVVLSGVLAWDLEHELHAFSRTNRGVYKEKAQSLRFNIKFAKNPELFKVRRGEGGGHRRGDVGRHQLGAWVGVVVCIYVCFCVCLRVILCVWVLEGFVFLVLS